MKFRSPVRCFPLLVLAAQLAASAPAATPAIPFTSDRWNLQEAEETEYLGRPALAGTAWLKDVDIEDGVIEVDVAVDGSRCYPAIIFRRQAEGEYEHVYLRPHRAGLYPDAVQYAPVFNGVGGWQLYSGPGFTAGVSLPKNQWIHVRIEVSGIQARVYVGDPSAPVLVIDDLKHGRSKGALGLQSPRNGSARFAGFAYAAAGDLSFEPSVPPEPVPGVITDWELSPAAPTFDLSPPRYLDGKPATTLPWLAVKSEGAGLVDIARYRKPAPAGISQVWARTIVHSRRKEPRPFSFGYSDDVSIYLNGHILYRGQSGFKRQDPSFLGILGWNDTVYLPLEEGDNELVLAVSEKFGGWGFMVRDLEAIYRHPSLQEVWELADQLRAPESVAFDADRQVLYVSDFVGDCISRIALDGTIIARDWVTGLTAPTGLKLVGGKLHAVERSGVAVIDPGRGAIVSRRPIPGAAFPNDLDLDETGAIYVTDSFKDRIYRIAGETVETWLGGPAVENPNGILVEPGRVLVGVTGDSTLKSIDRTIRRVTIFLALDRWANMDGLVADGNGGYMFSDYYGRIYRADASGRKTLLLDRRGPHQYTADFAYIPEKHMLIVPSLYDHRLTAYRLASP